MGLFGGKKEGGTSSESTPVNVVKQLKDQGLTNNQIVQSLQSQGFKSHQIFDALTQVESQSSGPIGAPSSDQFVSPEETPMQQSFSSVYQGSDFPSPPQSYGSSDPMVLREEIESVAEGIIEEKWVALMEDIKKIIEWKESIESRMIKLETGLNSANEQIAELRKGVLGKISDYEKGVSDVGVELKAMQKVFKESVPEFTSNISELSRLVTKLNKTNSK